MNPKPSLRRDSLEKAARQEAWILLTNSGKGNRATKPCREQLDDWQKVIVRFAERHGAKVRRETLKEAADVARFHCCGGKDNCLKSIEEDILSLTPRGPEKGRRAK